MVIHTYGILTCSSYHDNISNTMVRPTHQIFQRSSYHDDISNAAYDSRASIYVSHLELTFQVMLFHEPCAYLIVLYVFATACCVHTTTCNTLLPHTLDNDLIKVCV